VLVLLALVSFDGDNVKCDALNENDTVDISSSPLPSLSSSS